MRLIRHGTAQDNAPAWAPDGTRIAFASEEQGPGIYLTDVRGDGPVKVTGSNVALEGGETYGELGWSPDGTAIAFAGSFEVPSDIYIVNSDGSGLTQLTDDRADGTPSWRPVR